jgi:ribosomal-protein-alanine N-acetyltransferase
MTALSPPIMVAPIGALALVIVAEINAACFDERWDRDAIAALLASPGSTGWIAQVDGGPGGYFLARAAGDEVEILSVGVLPELRRRGVGRALLAAAIARFGQRPIFLEVAEDNAPALALYASARFLPVGRRTGYYRRAGVALDAVLLRRLPG